MQLPASAKAAANGARVNGSVAGRAQAYFGTPLAYVFAVIFVALTGAFTFYFGNFFDRGQADLQAFFLYHPWLYLILVPAVAMRLWAEERKSGTIELLMTLPVAPWEAIVGSGLTHRICTSCCARR